MDTVKKTIKLNRALFLAIDQSAKRANLSFSEALRLRLEPDQKGAQMEHRVAHLQAEIGMLLDKLTAQNLQLTDLIGATLAHAAFARTVMEHSISPGSKAASEAQNAAQDGARSAQKVREQVQLSVFDEDENG
jgi:hypothetical protein